MMKLKPIALLMLSLVLNACLPQVTTGERSQQISLINGPEEQRAPHLKEIFAQLLSRQDPSLDLGFLAASDYYDSNFHIGGAQTVENASIAFRTLGAGYGLLVGAPIFEREVYYRSTSEYGVNTRVVASKVQVEVIIIDPLNRSKVASFRSGVYEALRLELSTQALIDPANDDDLKALSTQALGDLLPSVYAQLQQLLANP
ncbi:MAG: hypothetical protein R2880_03310 [Deinococcales bacterium]